MTILRYVPIILFLFAVVSCQTNENSTYDALTPTEYQQLVKKARIFVATSPMRLTPISDNDKRFINSHEPKFYPRYYSDKGGVFKMVWKIDPGYSVRVIGKGQFLKPSCKFRLTVSRFAQ